MKRLISLFLLLLVVEQSCTQFIEGDILIRKETDLASNQDMSGGVRLADPDRLWPGGYVNYKFDRTFQNRNSKKQVTNMMTYIESKFDGCITFENIESSNREMQDFVLITADGGGKGSGTKCFSDLGRLGGKQILNLDSSCLRNHTIVHELLHTLGFSHEHNRPDRDSFVTVITENIVESRKSDFKKRENGNSEWFEPSDVDTQNTPFDFQSVLLYPPSLSSLKSVSKNGEKTLKYNAPLISSWPNFPPDEEPLTIIDIVEIALAYNCPLDQQTLIQYIHYNRLSSSQKLSGMETKVKVLEQTLQDQQTIAIETESRLKKLEETVLALRNVNTDCELGWSGSGGSCYKRLNGSEQNCLETCKGHGGKLADINSRKENEFIMSLMDKDGLAYIGGGNYANWGPGGGPPEGLCALLEVHNDGIWWRTDCSMFNSCICEVM
eukprot:GFUD01069681.1.p1 GENE.GFUD01069681.1~~GFUD01069681.1.p1  ORF type:complete len:438 (+),score=56.84 GFUD01069681.1:49-1362(+)